MLLRGLLFCYFIVFVLVGMAGCLVVIWLLRVVLKVVVNFGLMLIVYC